MGKFDYKKWVTSYKTNKKSLFEQNTTGSSTVFYKTRNCGPCNNVDGLYTISGSNYQGGIGAVADNVVVSNYEDSWYWGCGPIQMSDPVEVPDNIIPDDFGPTLSSYDIPSMNNPEFQSMFGQSYLYPEDYDANCAGDILINNAGGSVFTGVCCDTNAPNYGQTNVPTLNIQFADGNISFGNHLDTALMLNQFELAFCDNSLCQGSEELPDDDKAGADSGGDDDQQSQQADKAFKKRNRRRGDRRDPKGQSTRDNRGLTNEREKAGDDKIECWDDDDCAMYTWSKNCCDSKGKCRPCSDPKPTGNKRLEESIIKKLKKRKFKKRLQERWRKKGESLRKQRSLKEQVTGPFPTGPNAPSGFMGCFGYNIDAFCTADYPVAEDLCSDFCTSDWDPENPGPLNSAVSSHSINSNGQVDGGVCGCCTAFSNPNLDTQQAINNFCEDWEPNFPDTPGGDSWGSALDTEALPCANDAQFLLIGLLGQSTGNIEFEALEQGCQNICANPAIDGSNIAFTCDCCAQHGVSLPYSSPPAGSTTSGGIKPKPPNRGKDKRKSKGRR